MPDLNDARSFLLQENGLAVVSTTQSDGRVLSSVGAAGQPHRDYPDAGHMIHEDAGADLAARIAAWMHDAPPTTA